jgi:DNA-binding NtrC family response regulator/tetratricopeptide (TPR) repeat protein
VELRKIQFRHDSSARELHAALLSTALHLTGDNHSAERLALDTTKIRGAKPATLARCHIVLGSVYRERGLLRDAVSHLEKACRFAEAAHNAELQCWSWLRLMTVAGEMDGPEAAIAMIPEIRRRVTHLADPIVLATLHLWIAEFESKRGLLTSAARHIQMGRAILSTHHNVWLEGSAAIDDCCLSYLRSEIGAAFGFASDALRCAADSGHATTRMAACTNLAHLHMASGDFCRAEELFQDALTCWRSGGANEVAILDGLAQLELARKNFSKCESYLNSISKIERDRATKPGYYQSWSFRTQLQSLIAQGRTREAHEFMEAIQPHLHKFHPVLKLALSGLRAEILLAKREFEAANVVLAEAYVSRDGQSPEELAHLEVTLAKALAQSDQVVFAPFHFKRAVRIFTHLKQMTAAANATAELEKLGSVQHRQIPFTSPTFAKADALRQIKSLLDVRGSPELLAQEALELFRQLDCIKQVFLINDVDHSDQAGSSAESSARSLRVEFGPIGRKQLSIVAIPNDDLASHLDCVATCRIVDAVVALQSLQHKLDEQGELWPADEGAATNGFIFASAAMQEIAKVAQKVAASNVTVLITGETGTGKEVLARELHRRSRRADKAFAPFNCAAVPRDLVESQLFGYRRGAFSGAHEHFDGIIRAAEGGTLFLDEIGELSVDIQPKLLRFLESGEVQPLGAVRAAKADVRIIAASNANLESGLEQGTFREDLFYRLNIIRFRIPPLRERREEILPLVNHFLRRFCEEYAKTSISVSERAAECLLLYRWPGNVRQLANELRRLVALADNGFVIQPEQLSPDILAGFRNPAPLRSDKEVSVSLNQSIETAVEQLERSMLRHALANSGWRVDQAAKALGISRKGLYLKRMRLGLMNPAGLTTILDDSLARET